MVRIGKRNVRHTYIVYMYINSRTLIPNKLLLKPFLKEILQNKKSIYTDIFRKSIN